MNAAKKLLCVLMTLTIFVACSSEPKSDGTDPDRLEKLTFMLGTSPGVGSAPWLLGIEKGFFRDAGIDLNVQPSDSPSVGMATVLAGRAEFASVDFTTLGLAKTDDPTNDMRILSITYARPPYEIFSLKSGANVEDPADLSGLTLYGPTGSSMLKIVQAWLDHLGIEDVKFKEVDSASREPLLLAGEIDAAVGFATSAPGLQSAAAEQGEELVVLEPAEAGLDTFYASGIAAKKSFIDSEDDLTRRFVAAAMRSFEYAYAHPEEAADTLAAEYPEFDPKESIPELKVLESLFTDAGRLEHPGVIDPAKVTTTIDYAKDVLGIKVAPEELYLTGYVPEDQ